MTMMSPDHSLLKRVAGKQLLLTIMVVLCPAWSRADCIAFGEAKNHVGSTQCVQGKVLDVKKGSRGVTFLEFCEDYRVCPFTVVVFPRDLKHVGDVRYLRGKQIGIHGKIVLYDGRAEIILSRYKQLRGQAAQIPPLPKDYDVDRRGRYSAGKFSYPDSPGRPTRKKQGPPVPIDDPAPDGNDE